MKVGRIGLTGQRGVGGGGWRGLACITGTLRPFHITLGHVSGCYHSNDLTFTPDRHVEASQAVSDNSGWRPSRGSGGWSNHGNYVEKMEEKNKEKEWKSRGGRFLPSHPQIS